MHREQHAAALQHYNSDEGAVASECAFSAVLNENANGTHKIKNTSTLPKKRESPPLSPVQRALEEELIKTAVDQLSIDQMPTEAQVRRGDNSRSTRKRIFLLVIRKKFSLCLLC